MTPDYIITFPMPNNGTVQFHAVDFAEESEHIVIATDDCGYTFAKADMAGEIGNPANVFTGV